MKRLLRVASWILLALVCIAASAALTVCLLLRGSLAQLDGHRPLAGLHAPVVIERDALGVPTLRASNRVDTARALGFLHAQERYFQMDLLRRRGAGELAALFGPTLVDHDIDVRRHNLRHAARRSVETLSPYHRTVLDAYVAGVNAGLSALRTRPPEYYLLRQSPEPWLPEDSILVGFAMFFTLQDSTGEEDLRSAAAYRHLPPTAADFFFPRASQWDAALDASEIPVLPPPPRDALDFRTPNAAALNVSPTAASAGLAAESWANRPQPGSNSWGIRGDDSASGAATIANDMHLDLALPNIWYRACLRWTDPDGESRRLVGVTLPGTPVLTVGSTGRIAWGFTNATLDTTDVVLVEVDPSNPNRYKAPDGVREFETVTEALDVAGESPRIIHHTRTIWGPVVGDDEPGRKRVLAWIAHRPGAMNFGLLDLERAANVSEALAIAPGCGIPVQNLLVADRDGALAWTLIGRLPRRIGFDGSLPVSWADGSCRWDDWLALSDYPARVAAPGERLWTANNRILGSPVYHALGPWNTDPGARARQIRDDLVALPAPVAEPNLMTIHRDDRALFLARWRLLLLRTLAGLDSHTNATRYATLRHSVEASGDRAETNSVGFRLVRAFRFQVMNHLMAPALDRCRVGTESLRLQTERHEQPVWTLLEERPLHLLNPNFPTYDALLEDAADRVLADLDKRGLPLAEATWGQRNLVSLEHPIARAIPQLGRWLNIGPRSLPGDDHMPRIQGPRFGSSQRLVVAPGHEERGLFHMPGGQSGHFLSPYYRAGHAAWEDVEPTPLLPTRTEHTLTLLPPSAR